MGKLLVEAADWFKARKTPIRGWYEDDGGRYAFAVEVDGQRFLVAAKKYLHGGQASFMTKLAERAADQDAFLLLFVQGSGKRLVFDPVQVRDFAEPSNPNESKRAQNGEDWLDAPSDWAVDFRSWYDHRKMPKQPRFQDDHERPSKPFDITAWGNSDD